MTHTQFIPRLFFELVDESGGSSIGQPMEPAAEPMKFQQGAKFKDMRGSERRASDVHIHQSDGVCVDRKFFRRVEYVALVCEAPMNADNNDTPGEFSWGVHIEFVEGGTLHLSDGYYPVWTEPERH